MHHLNGASLALRRKGAVHIGLPKSFAQVAISGLSAAPPARKLLLLAGQRVRKEVKIFVRQGFSQIGRGPVNKLPAHVGFPVLQRMHREQFLFGTEEIGRRDDVVIAGRGVHRLHVTFPVNGRHKRTNLGQAHFVVHVLGVAALNVIHLCLRHRGFQFNDRVCIPAGLRFFFSGQHKHLAHVRAILLQGFD